MLEFKYPISFHWESLENQASTSRVFIHCAQTHEKNTILQKARKVVISMHFLVFTASWKRAIAHRLVEGESSPKRLYLRCLFAVEPNYYLTLKRCLLRQQLGVFAFLL